MSSLLRLGIPTPTSYVQFEHLCDGDADRLLRLSAARRRVATEITALMRREDLDATAHQRTKESLLVYKRLWHALLVDLQRQGARAATRLAEARSSAPT